MTNQIEGQMSIFDFLDQDSWCGKTYLEHSVPTVEKISEPSLKKQRKSQTKLPLFLNLRGGSDGHRADVFWEMGGALLGEYTMRSFGEFPNEERESLLSQILEETPHPKYSLSAKACQGILRRAQKRGKKLPELLEKTLIKQSASKNEPESQGGGKGILIQHERTGALSTVNNQAVCYETIEGGAEPITASKAGFFLNARSNGKADTLVATDYKDPQMICYGIDRASFNQGQNALYDFSIEEETAQTLVSRGPGGGTEQTVGALCARDYKGVGNQYVDEHKIIIQDNRESSG